MEKYLISLKMAKYNISTEMVNILSIILIKWPEKFLWIVGGHMFTSQ